MQTVDTDTTTSKIRISKCSWIESAFLSMAIAVTLCNTKQCALIRPCLQTRRERIHTTKEFIIIKPLCLLHVLEWNFKQNTYFCIHMNHPQ